MSDTIAHRASELASRAMSHPATVVLFNVGVAAGIACGAVNGTNLAISIITADAVFLSSIADRRALRKMQIEIDELTKAHPDIDDKAIDARID